MMFYLGFFVGWVIGIFSAVMLVYIVRRETEQVADGERLCSKKENPVRWADTFYVDVATGKYHVASDLLKEYGRQTLCKLVSEGKFVNEGHWEKMQEGKK
jgi:hypothetical protein